MMQPIKVKPRERTAILQSLGAGVVPRVGLPLIQVGRQREVTALIDDLKRIEEGSAAFRFIIGRFGSGKSFFLSLIRTVALERQHVVLQADITPDRHFHSTSGQALALYTELITNMATRAKPEGGALAGLVERFVSDVANEAGAAHDAETLERAVEAKIGTLRDMSMGVHFIRVMARYVQGFAQHNESLQQNATRWLRGEYRTKTDAKKDLEVRDIIVDANLYDMLKVWAVFVRAAGYKGLFVNFDEMVVLSERLPNAASRAKNYEILLHMLNDALQGQAQGFGLCFAGTEEFLIDGRRGLYSYEALRSRLADNPHLRDGLVDMSNPVIRLQTLSQEELFVLLEKLTIVHAAGNPAKCRINDDGIRLYMKRCLARLGASAFQTPRESVRGFIGLLNVLEQNPGTKLESVLDGAVAQVEPPKPDKPEKADGLSSFRLE